MADKPTGAEGGVAFSGDQPPTVPGFKDPDSNIAQSVDVRKIAVDPPNDRDIDDPYPGGPNGPANILLT